MGDVIRETGSVVGLFVVAGVGLGLSGYLVVSRLTVGGVGGGGIGGSAGAAIVSGLLFFQAMSVIYFSGAAVAVAGGVLSGLRSGESATGALAGAVGSFLGFYLLVAIAFLLVSVAADGGGGISPGDNVTLIAASGLPAALVGGVSGAVAGVWTSAPTASRTAW